MRYGMPYQGSKNKIAENILKFLPRGKRLVDLFGGGGAISHCASLSYKWESVLYNELNPLVYKAFRMAINGEFREEKRWISHEDFFRLRYTDPYVAFCFSFGNNLCGYAYNRELEPWKKALHYARVFKDNSLLKEMGIDSDGSRADLKRFFKDRHKEDLQSLGSLERLESLESLERLPIETINGSYTDYVYQDGDVVYCDPPYEDTDCKGYKGFDNEAFYQWVETRPYTVYFSTYEMDKLNDRFFKCWEEDKRVTSGTDNSLTKRECIYTNREPERTSLIPIQLTLF